MKRVCLTVASLLTLLIFNGCVTVKPQVSELPEWEDPRLDEASGLVVLPETGFLMSHNDDGDSALYVATPGGTPKMRIVFPELDNRDWEDLARIPLAGGGSLVVIGELGDNSGQYPSVALHFVEIREDPLEGKFWGTLEVFYPDGPRDTESLAWDAADHRLLLLSKRDRPPRLYGVNLPESLTKESLESLEAQTALFLGEVKGIPAPSPETLAAQPRLGRWSGQPTGMALDGEGRLAAIITYNDLHLFRRAEGKSWSEAMAGVPETVDIPLLGQTEAIDFSADGRAVFIVPEGKSPRILRVPLPD